MTLHSGLMTALDDQKPELMRDALGTQSHIQIKGATVVV